MVNQGFRADINALRAIAVIAVIGYHFGIPGFGGGFAGVDVFFVISGYLITFQIQQALLADNFKFGAFYISRLRRIFPALAVMCISVLFFGWFYMLPEAYTEYAKTAFNALYFNSNTGFIKTEGARGYFEAVNVAVSPLLHTWSLSIEGQYYLVFPLLWVIAYKKFTDQLPKIIFTLLLVALAYFVFDTQHHTEASFYSLSVRAWEFIAGASLVLVAHKKTSLIILNVLNTFGLVVLIACIYFLDGALLWPSFWTLIPISATVLILLTQQATCNHWLFKQWFVQKTGDMSYSLYLWHWPLIVFAKQYAASYDRSLEIFEFALLLLATYFLAFLSWQFVEKPIRANRKFWTSKKLLTAVLVVLIGFWGVWRTLSITSGLTWRFDGFLQNNEKLAFKYMPSYFNRCYSSNSIILVQDKLDLCEINKDSEKKPEFIVWGDSHAQQYYPAYKQAALESQLNGLIATRQNCRPTLPDQNAYYTLPSEVPSCIEFNNKVNFLVANSSNIKTVILGRLWLHGESIDQTIGLVKSLTKMGKRVVLTGVIPNPKYRVPETWVQRQIWTRTLIKDIAVSRDKDELPRITEYVQAQLSAEALKGDVIFMNAMDHFCNQTRCFYVRDGVENFFDMNHITEAKALEFVEDFKRALKD